ncbi:MAG: DUF2794 domain-containing protein [Kordiimonas sp.]
MDDASLTHMFELTSHQTPGAAKSKPRYVYLMRTELSSILNVYGRMVAAGEWHDYAIDHLEDIAIFSIFRRASEMPLYRIIKDPSLTHKQGTWRITGMNGQILKRGKDLSILLRYFDKQLLKAIG